MYTWQAAQHFAALADETRLGLLLSLANIGRRGAPLEAIAERTGMAPPELRRHLDELIAARLAQFDASSGHFHADLRMLNDLFGFLRNRLVGNSAALPVLTERRPLRAGCAAPRSLRAMLGEQPSQARTSQTPTARLTGLPFGIADSAARNPGDGDGDGGRSGGRPNADHRGAAETAAARTCDASMPENDVSDKATAVDAPRDSRRSLATGPKTAKSARRNGKRRQPDGGDAGVGGQKPCESTQSPPQSAMAALSAIVEAAMAMPATSAANPTPLAGPLLQRAISQQPLVALTTRIANGTSPRAANGQQNYPRVRVVVDRSSPQLKFWLVAERREAPQVAQTAAPADSEASAPAGTDRRPRRLTDKLAALSASGLRSAG